MVPDNIGLLTQPAYSPEPNPQENVWQCPRQNYLSNRVFNTYDAIVDACCQAWSSLAATPDRITSIATRSWAEQVMVQRRWYYCVICPGSDARAVAARRQQKTSIPHVGDQPPPRTGVLPTTRTRQGL